VPAVVLQRHDKMDKTHAPLVATLCLRTRAIKLLPELLPAVSSADERVQRLTSA